MMDDGGMHALSLSFRLQKN